MTIGTMKALSREDPLTEYLRYQPPGSTWGLSQPLLRDPAVNAAWERADIKDDPVTQSNKLGYISYGNTGRPNSRGTQLFINYKDNSFLDAQRFSPFGQVVSGMDVVVKLNSEYGSKPQDAQATIRTEGNKFLISKFPKLDYIRRATIEK